VEYANDKSGSNSTHHTFSTPLTSSDDELQEALVNYSIDFLFKLQSTQKKIQVQVALMQACSPFGPESTKQNNKLPALKQNAFKNGNANQNMDGTSGMSLMRLGAH